jgi:hypothetical protein
MAEPGVGKSQLFFEFKATSQSGWMLLETVSIPELGEQLLFGSELPMTAVPESSYPNQNLLPAVRQKPTCKCDESDDHQKSGRIREGVEPIRELLH